jgi:phosphoribosylamine---glycine ligase
MKRKILIIGSGGREHALAKCFKQSPTVDRVYVAPGNAGMHDSAFIVPIQANEFAKIEEFVKKEKIDLVFVGPEAPLSMGIVDYLESKGIVVFGPNQVAAQLESSKSFAKRIMDQYNIPTAKYTTVSSYQEAIEYLVNHPAPIVIKADGLMAGKGVTVALTDLEAILAIENLYPNHTETHVTVIEEFLDGEEFSLMAFVYHDRVIPLPIARDHKRAFDHDLGPNTGGMGAYSPVPQISDETVSEAMEKVMIPMAKAMVELGMPFIGILYGGLIATKDGVKTIEFNVRFGDPETEVILPRVLTPIDQIIFALINKEPIDIKIDPRVALTVVIASRGYPTESIESLPINNLNEVDATIYHMGTRLENNQFINVGGRVLSITGLGESLDEVRITIYREIKKIDAPHCFYRTDIGVIK